jgi:membrane fusion protein (multidrug efflux system)
MKITYIAVAALLVVLTACGGGSDKDKLAKLIADRETLNTQIADLETKVGLTDTTTKIIKFKEVAVEPVELSTFEHYIDIQGKVDGEEVVDINAKMPGTIQTVLVQEGRAVTKGQVLATLESESISKNIEAVKTQYELVKSLYERQKNLWDQKIGTEIQYLQAKTSKEAMEKQIAAANEQLEMAKIKAPISGTIEMFNAKVGNYAMPGMPIARIVNPAHLKVTAEMAESYASKVHTGNDIIVEFPSLSKTLHNKISFAAKYINPASRSFTIESKLPFDDDFRANMIAVVKVNDYKNAKAMVLPVNLIQKDETGFYVMVADKTTAKKVIVTKGVDYNGMAEITSGLAVGDQVITKGYQDLNDGDVIKF